MVQTSNYEVILEADSTPLLQTIFTTLKDKVAGYEKEVKPEHLQDKVRAEVKAAVEFYNREAGAEATQLQFGNGASHFWISLWQKDLSVLPERVILITFKNSY